MKYKQHQSGFMMSELIVSLAIISSALFMLLALKKDILHRQSILQQAMSTVTTEANGLALLRRVNPALEPFGRRDIGGNSVLNWTSRQITKPRHVLQWLGRETEHEVALYSVDYTVEINGRNVSQGNVEILGRKRTPS